MNRTNLRGTRPAPSPAAKEKLPPHSPEAEALALGCVLLAGELKSQAEVDTLLEQLRPDDFYELKHRAVHNAAAALRMGATPHAVDTRTVYEELKRSAPELAQAPETAGWLSRLPDEVPSLFNWPTYLDTLKQYRLKRWCLAKTTSLARLAESDGISAEILQKEFADLEEKASKARNHRPALVIHSVDECLSYNPPKDLCLVGDFEIYKGYDGVSLIAGPGGVGKSAVTMSLALAGARGSGLWMGRKVHRQFKTLIIQAENGNMRLKKELEQMATLHPNIPIRDCIYISEPPEGGLPFHRPEFRRAVARQVETLGAELVILDPWSHIQVEEASKDVSEKLGEIRSCFPAGDECPALVISAHTKKPRTEGLKRGRALVNEISGSVTLSNTARTAWVMLPFTDDQEDDRILWALVKCNNGAMYGDTVWHRRLGTHFEHDSQIDPAEFWRRSEDSEADDHRVKAEDLVKAFGTESVLKKSTLARRLVEQCQISYQTGMRIITPGHGGYLAGLVEKTKEGWIQLRNGEEE